MPPRSAPARKPALSTAVEIAFEAASCRGVLASEGRSAACAGRWAVASTVKIAARTRTSASGASAATAAATAHQNQRAADRDRNQDIAPGTAVHHHACNGAARPAGTIRESAATPTALAPPCSYA